ncbi:prepilin peptidase [Pararhizobium gei]|uniref:prepilin peptidase n=1 Tax=Pararhizobium gei TaxID=1395951 RepID=UPI0023DA4975|nr:A24 family peptidase [Rhizobium gei]
MLIALENLAFTVLALQLAVIAVIDARTFIIPDRCNILLALSGLLFQGALGSFDPVWTGIGVLVFAGCFAGVRAAHFHISGRIGLGMGDVKLAAAAACWIGLDSFPTFLAASSLAALAFALIRRWSLVATGAPDDKIPFGPFLASGLMLAWICQVNSIPLIVLESVQA